MLSLLLLLLLLPNGDAERYRPYLNFYFTKLKSINEKDYFLSNFNDAELIFLIKKITELFHKYHFFHALLLEQADDQEELDLLTQWQRHYYIDIYNEYHSLFGNASSNAITEIYQILEENTSFQFLVKLLLELKDQSVNIDTWESLEKAYSYYQFKKDSLYKKESKVESEQKLDSYTEVINSGGSLYDKVSSDEKEHISKSINMFLISIRNSKL